MTGYFNTSQSWQVSYMDCLPDCIMHIPLQQWNILSGHTILNKLKINAQSLTYHGAYSSQVFG